VGQEVLRGGERLYGKSDVENKEELFPIRVEPRVVIEKEMQPRVIRHGGKKKRACSSQETD